MSCGSREQRRSQVPVLRDQRDKAATGLLGVAPPMFEPQAGAESFPGGGMPAGLCRVLLPPKSFAQVLTAIPVNVGSLHVCDQVKMWGHTELGWTPIQ